MKYEVRVRVTVHCESPAQALSIVQDRLKKAGDVAKVKLKRATVRPKGSAPWGEHA